MGLLHASKVEKVGNVRAFIANNDRLSITEFEFKVQSGLEIESTQNSIPNSTDVDYGLERSPPIDFVPYSFRLKGKIYTPSTDEDMAKLLILKRIAHRIRNCLTKCNVGEFDYPLKQIVGSMSPLEEYSILVLLSVGSCVHWLQDYSKFNASQLISTMDLNVRVGQPYVNHACKYDLLRFLKSDDNDAFYSKMEEYYSVTRNDVAYSKAQWYSFSKASKSSAIEEITIITDNSSDHNDDLDIQSGIEEENIVEPGNESSLGHNDLVTDKIPSSAFGVQLSNKDNISQLNTLFKFGKSTATTLPANYTERELQQSLTNSSTVSPRDKFSRKQGLLKHYSNKSSRITREDFGSNTSGMFRFNNFNQSNKR